MLPQTVSKVWKVEFFLGLVEICWGVNLIVGTFFADFFDTSQSMSWLRHHVGELAFGIILMLLGSSNIWCLSAHATGIRAFGIADDHWLLWRRLMAIVAGAMWGAVAITIFVSNPTAPAAWTYLVGFTGLWWATARDLSPNRIARTLLGQQR